MFPAVPNLTFAMIIAMGFACFPGMSRTCLAEDTGGSVVFENLRARARELAREAPGASEGAKLPPFVADLAYDQYLQIRVPDRGTVWHGEDVRFHVQFFHPGYLYREPVRVYILEEGERREIPFSPDFFDYSRLTLPEPVPEDLSFAGIRLLYPLHEVGHRDEIAVFLGMSYLRLLGARQVFGASLRGLAIDTAESTGEEFPRFSEFAVERPKGVADQIRVYALLESRRVTGAYSFLIRPGEVTEADVEASLFFREEVQKVGLAPLTSMFLFGENQSRNAPDFRPEVHDSDGLLVETKDGGRLWRPLTNPPKVHRVSRFTDPAGFGLLQRDRDFDHYQDLEARSELRPSLWVKPWGDWGKGRIELVEIPTEHEGNDNIVAYWVPEGKIPAQEEYPFRYTVSAFLGKPDLPPVNLWSVEATRVEPTPERIRFVLDFEGGTPVAADQVALGVTASRGQIKYQGLQDNPRTGGLRAVFDHIPEGEEAIELRVELKRGDRVVSETWVYPVWKQP